MYHHEVTALSAYMSFTHIMSQDHRNVQGETLYHLKLQRVFLEKKKKE